MESIIASLFGFAGAMVLTGVVSRLLKKSLSKRFQGNKVILLSAMITLILVGLLGTLTGDFVSAVARNLIPVLVWVGYDLIKSKKAA